MVNMNDITRKMINDAVSNIHTSLPAKINKYDAEKMRAEITLISKQNLEGEMVEIPPVLEVPVGFMKAGPFIIRPPFKKGDVVVVVFSEKAIDQLLISGKSEEVKYTRMHSIDDAIIVNSLQLESESDLNSSYTSDLLIENQEAGSRIVMKANGDLLIETNGKVNATSTDTTTITAPKIIVDAETHLGGSGGEGLSFGESLKTYLDGHTHPGDSGGTTGPPTSPSPAPSSKVFTN
jgi:hypothetical protein